MKKIIIGIHGIRNKPPKNLLKNWWKKSIIAGLENRGIPNPNFDFELVYWADLEYKKPFDPHIADRKDPLYLKEPFIIIPTAKILNKSHKLKKNILDKLEEGLDKIIIKENSFSGLDSIADIVLKRMFKDMDVYYHGKYSQFNNKPAKFIIREKLAEILKKIKINK